MYMFSNCFSCRHFILTLIQTLYDILMNMSHVKSVNNYSFEMIFGFFLQLILSYYIHYYIHYIFNTIINNILYTLYIQYNGMHTHVSSVSIQTSPTIFRLKLSFRNNFKQP